MLCLMQRIIKMTWLVKVELDDKDSATKVGRVIDSMSRARTPIKLIDLEYEELEDIFASS